MTPSLLAYLCDPVDGSSLELVNASYDARGHIVRGTLKGAAREYPVIDGIPRFTEGEDVGSVDSFGEEWNSFNFVDFKENWLTHTIKNTFGSTDAFRGKVVVDAGAGSGSQAKWICESGAAHVIALELSRAVDGVIRRNLAHTQNVDIVQCSIDRPPLKPGTIGGIVMCHNVIQHTRSVEDTARALWRIVAPGGEFVFNCYPVNDFGFARKVRWNVYLLLRRVLSRLPYPLLKAYAKAAGLLRLVPGLGFVLDKTYLIVCGDVPRGPRRLRRMYAQTVLNTFDCYGSHTYQHHKRDDEIRNLVVSLRPREVLNEKDYFLRPAPAGIALRLVK